MNPEVESVQHIALLSLKLYSNDGISIGKQVLKDLSIHMGFEKISSVYKVKMSDKRPFHAHDLRKILDFEGLSLAFQVSTMKTPTELITEVYKIEKRHSNETLHRSLSLNLLAYEDRTTMTGNLTLPHPEFHTRPEILFPAAEVWGDYYHPILKKNLHELTREFANLRWGEFYEQGKTLLDF